MVVIVIHTVLVTSHRMRRLDAPDETRLGQNTKRVVHGLSRYRADVCPYKILDLIGRAMRQAANSTEDRETLGGDLQADLSQRGCWILSLVWHKS
jgi:hypothetical protein